MADEGLLIEGGIVGAEEIVPDPVDAVMVELWSRSDRLEPRERISCEPSATYLTVVLDRGVEPIVQLRIAGKANVLLRRYRVQEGIVGQIEPGRCQGKCQSGQG